MPLDANDIGNATIRLGYVTGLLHSGEYRAYLIEQGAMEDQIDAAYHALVVMVDAAFYSKRRGS